MMGTVVVTGAGSGIGRAISIELATLGWRVIATDLSIASAEETVSLLPVNLQSGHEAHSLNVTVPEDSRRIAEEVSGRLGLNAWVSNAGVSKMKRFTEISDKDYSFTLDVNLKGVFFCGQAAAHAMIRQESGGVIVNTASMAGKQGRVPFLADYVASKFGVIGLTQAMAFELAEHNITVNSVCPGFVDTPMQARELAWEAELKGTTPDHVKDSWVADTPLNRLQKPEDVADAVGFLLSSKARFITGEALSVNGGAYMD
ncbi:MAG: SDR family oxidoreductase [Microbacteriaceae bacterium]|jgi:meso-butanediol dehydrogenase / (S,S)-butanediol dehydrogenase / diacetyl reductase|nr:SDR family oxidoreductase [Microbacteriaceae bacterium]